MALSDPHLFWRWGSAELNALVQDHMELALDLLHAPLSPLRHHPLATWHRLGFTRPVHIRCWPTHEGFRATADTQCAGRRLRLFEQRVVFPGAVNWIYWPEGPRPKHVWAFHEQLGPQESRRTCLVGQAPVFGRPGRLPKEGGLARSLAQSHRAILEGLLRSQSLWAPLPELLVAQDACLREYRRGMAQLQSWGHLNTWEKGPEWSIMWPE